MKQQIFTIGHSTRSLDELVSILKHHDIQNLVDIRHFPHSRHNPQFNKENLEIKISKNGINYFWFEILGGFRKGGYKAYTKTKDFQKGISELLKIVKKPTAIMCAEILYFKCHRKFISDVLKRKKYKVIHIYDEKKSELHKITKRRKIKCD